MLPRERVLWLLRTLAALCLLASPGGTTASGGQPGRSLPSGQKVAIFGVDAADWRVIDPLVAAGRLPAFARLKQVASTGLLRSTPPLLSPLIWTTMATGRTADENGVLDFMVDAPGGGQAPVNGGARRVKALWEIWSEAGRRVMVTGWWATWPADHVRGLIASDRIATPHLASTTRPDVGLVYPPSLAADVTRRIAEPSAIDYASLSRLIPVTAAEFARAEAAGRASTGRLYADPIAHFRAAIAATRSYRRISTELVQSVQPDFWAVYYEIVDTTSHLFSKDRRRAEGAVASAYEEVDAALADTARALDPDTLVLVVSDHGFQPADAGIREDPADLTAGATAWHRPYGIVAATTAGALAGTRSAPPVVSLGVVSPLDIAPTVLARGGLPLAGDMPGRVIPALAPPGSQPSRIASYGSHVMPDVPRDGKAMAAAELERLRALGYVSGSAPTSSLARVNLGEVLYHKGDYRGAIRELEALLRVDPLNEHGMEWLARAYIALGRRDEALGLYDRLVRASASSSLALDPEVVLAATDIDVAAGRLDAAQSRLDRVAATVRRSAEALTAAGSIAQGKGRPELAEQSYRRALAASPSNTEALQRLLDLLLSLHKADEAVSVTAAAAKSFPSSPTHLSLAGEAALASRRYAEAERRFAAALALAPDADPVRLDLGRTQLLAGRPDACIQTLQPLPSTRDAEMLRGAAHSTRKDWPRAIAALERALSSGPATTDVLNALAVAQVESGKKADAIKSLERSLAMDSNQPAARALLQRARNQ